MKRFGTHKIKLWILSSSYSLFLSVYSLTHTHTHTYIRSVKYLITIICVVNFNMCVRSFISDLWVDSREISPPTSSIKWYIVFVQCILMKFLSCPISFAPANSHKSEIIRKRKILKSHRNELHFLPLVSLHFGLIVSWLAGSFLWIFFSIRLYFNEIFIQNLMCIIFRKSRKKTM